MSFINLRYWNSGIRLGYGSGFIANINSWWDNRLRYQRFGRSSSTYYDATATEYRYRDTRIAVRGSFSFVQTGYDWYEVTNDSIYHSVVLSSRVRGALALSGLSIKYSDSKSPSKLERVLLKGNDRIHGTSYNDYIKAKSGNDIIYGRNGNDRLYGENGNDRLYGQSGNDVLVGGNGNDVLDGGSGNDIAQFSSRANTIDLRTTAFQSTGDGRDRLISIEHVNGGGGNDRIIGNHANNCIRGQNGNDYIWGQNGNDHIYGNNGNDYLYGNAGDDWIYGGPGNDTLTGNHGNDKLWGREGRDIFKVSKGAGYDRIMDFKNGQDRILLGSGTAGVKLVNNSGDSRIYQGNDLLAVVIGAAGDLSRSGSYII